MQPAARRFWTGIGRAFAGAVLFALPILMTMEMWWLGFAMDRLRLALMVLLAIPLLTGLSHFIGFEETFDWQEDLRDAFIALAVGGLAAAAVLSVTAIIDWTDPFAEILGKITVQAVPASFGAMLGRSQFGTSDEKREHQDREKRARYGGEMFIMAAGALYLGFSVAPTEEMILISFRMLPWHAVALGLASVATMHAFVYTLQFKGTEPLGSRTMLQAFLRFSVAGYALVLAISLYVLWSFGSIEGMAASQTVMAAIVLAFPASIGAAAARVLL